jgi:hypothetical protein
MNGSLHSTKQFAAKPHFCFANIWTPDRWTEENVIYDSHFVAALVFFNATVERDVNTEYSLSQSNPVTASNSYHFDMEITTDYSPKTVNDNAFGVPLINTATVAFLTKNNFHYTQKSNDSRAIGKAIFCFLKM